MSKPFPNKFPGVCTACAARVEAGDGITTRNGSKWQVRHNDCGQAATPAEVVKPRAVFAPTDEQAHAVKEFATGENLAIEAGAGTGKTSTLVLLAEHAQSNGRTGMYLAFNKSIVVDSAARLPGNVTACTAHALAYRALGYQHRARLDSPHPDPMVLARMVGVPELGINCWGHPKVLASGFLAKLVMRTVDEFCKTADPAPTRKHVPYVEGVDLPTDDGRRTYANNDLIAAHVFPYVVKAWADIQRVDGTLPFNQSHYLKMFQLSDPKIDTDFILFDEAQDANPVMLAIVLAQIDRCQLVFVGDSQQQIYEFTGAVNAMTRIKEFGGRVCYLSQSFRFGHAVAGVANGLLGRLGAELRLAGFGNRASVVGPIDEPDAILCRTNAEAVRQVMHALAAGRRPYLVGDGKEIREFAKAARDLQTSGRTTFGPLAPFASWEDVQQYAGSDEGDPELKPMVKLIDDFGVDAILQAMSGLTRESDDHDVTVSTAHKAKGREWAHVQLAGDFFKPQGDKELSPSELRLLYVAVTRAQIGLDVDAVPHALRPPTPTD